MPSAFICTVERDQGRFQLTAALPIVRLNSNIELGKAFAPGRVLLLSGNKQLAMGSRQ
jgi:hypothetical protein